MMDIYLHKSKVKSLKNTYLSKYSIMMYYIFLQERSHTRAIFPSASGDLPVQTSWRGIIANTQAPSHSNAKFASVALRDLITLPYIWNGIYQRSKSNAIMPIIIKPIKIKTLKIIDFNSIQFKSHIFIFFIKKKIGSTTRYLQHI